MASHAPRTPVSHLVKTIRWFPFFREKSRLNGLTSSDNSPPDATLTKGFKVLTWVGRNVNSTTSFPSRLNLALLKRTWKRALSSEICQFLLDFIFQKLGQDCNRWSLKSWDQVTNSFLKTFEFFFKSSDGCHFRWRLYCWWFVLGIPRRRLTWPPYLRDGWIKSKNVIPPADGSASNSRPSTTSSKRLVS